jgi:hypothetical protein
MIKLLVTTLAAVLATGCASDPAIDAAPLAGVVAGQPWTFQTGATDAFLSSTGDTFFAEFYATAYTACTGSTPTGPSLIVAVPMTPGDYPMSLQRNMTFVNGSDNKIATDGRVVVDTVTATTVTGGLVGTYDDANSVNGQFTLTICPSTN